MADMVIQPQDAAPAPGPGTDSGLRREKMTLRNLMTAYRYLSDLAAR
jgi:hypothetical protein